jgi:hypothetical protein
MDQPTPLPYYKFKYDASIIGCLAYCEDGALVEICALLQEADGGRHGQVTLAHPTSGKIMGQVEIYSLVPAIEPGAELPRAVVRLHAKQPHLLPSTSRISGDFSEDSSTHTAGSAESSSTDDENDVSDAAGSDIDEDSGLTVATSGDLRRLEQKVDRLISKMRRLCKLLNVPNMPNDE